MQPIHQAFDEWCASHSWIWRLAVWLLMLHQTVRHLQDFEYQGFFGGINLGIHELGHVLTAPLGLTVSVAAGTLVQLAAPIASALMFLKQPDFFAIAVAGFWLSDNLFSIAPYAADARSMALPLVSPGGGETYHDWNYMLTDLGILAWDAGVARLFRGLGILSGLAALAFGLFVLWRMYRTPAAGGSENA